MKTTCVVVLSIFLSSCSFLRNGSVDTKDAIFSNLSGEYAFTHGNACSGKYSFFPDKTYSLVTIGYDLDTSGEYRSKRKVRSGIFTTDEILDDSILILNGTSEYGDTLRIFNMEGQPALWLSGSDFVVRTSEKPVNYTIDSLPEECENISLSLD